jgi:hypothetical protein
LSASQAFEFFLIVHNGERTSIASRDVLKAKLDDNGGVGKRGVTSGRRHAVDHKLIGRCGSRYDEASGTHAEGIDPAAVYLLGKGISGGRQEVGPPFVGVVTEAVDEVLGMFKSEADGDGLGFEGQADSMQIAIDIASGVSYGKDDGGDKVLSVGGTYTCHYTSMQEESLHTRGEMEFTVTGKDVVTDTLDDEGQLVATDMRMGINEDVRRSAEVTERT